MLQVEKLPPKMFRIAKMFLDAFAIPGIFHFYLELCISWPFWHKILRVRVGVGDCRSALAKVTHIPGCSCQILAIVAIHESKFNFRNGTLPKFTSPCPCLTPYSLFWQCLPVHPLRQRQTPSRHSPCPEQSATSHSSSRTCDGKC